MAEVFSAGNRYLLKYWIKLMPAPLTFKKRFLEFLQEHPIGNMGLVAVKAKQ